MKKIISHEINKKIFKIEESTFHNNYLEIQRMKCGRFHSLTIRLYSRL